MITAMAYIMAFAILGIIALLALNGRKIPATLNLILIVLVSYVLGVDPAQLIEIYGKW